jgi:Putative prokaryotic signal transducing protein
MQMITVFTAFNSADADVVNSRLDAAEFHPFIIHELAAQGMDVASGGIRVQVPEDEAEEARAFLAAPSEASSDTSDDSPST